FRANPSEVLRAIVDRLSQHYQSIAILSILNGDFMQFHLTAGLPDQYAHIPGNELRESFCQFCLAARMPIIIQDASLRPEMANLLPVQLGCTRYAGVPIRALSGEPIGTLCILDGHSDRILDDHDLEFLDLLAMRVNSEIEREARIKALEFGLDQTTSELKLAQQRLVQSEKLAVTGTLAASVAHDIRNILASISLQVDMGADRPNEALDYVRGSLGRFDVLAHRLLSYAKPNQTVFEHVDLFGVLKKVVSLVEGQFKISKVNLRIEGADERALIQADEGRLEHLFVNLLINALQFSRAGSNVTMNVECGLEFVQVVIQDEGSGIPAGDINHIFEPFVSTRKDGFGLGLYSCKAIVDDHQGIIECESVVGEGTRFTVFFPRCK
ncbi:MAG TPA: ATP-binding protein, partial [Fimbriimonas sp.]|nr:ATP-binding protein [Fimbriimonas sp.]